MSTWNFGIATIATLAFFAALAFGALSAAGASAETVTVVGSAGGCSTTYSTLFDTDGSPISQVTLSCPRHIVQVASARQ